MEETTPLKLVISNHGYKEKTTFTSGKMGRNKGRMDISGGGGGGDHSNTFKNHRERGAKKKK